MFCLGFLYGNYCDGNHDDNVFPRAWVFGSMSTVIRVAFDWTGGLGGWGNGKKVKGGEGKLRSLAEMGTFHT